MKIAVSVLALFIATSSFAQLEKNAYVGSAREYLSNFGTFQSQEADILGLQIDVEKTKKLGLDPAEYQVKMDEMKAPLLYSLFDNVAGVYNIWHSNLLAGSTKAPDEYEQSALMIDSCYFRYVLHLIGVWETLSGQTYGGTPPKLETKKNHRLNLEKALEYKNRAQSALDHPSEFPVVRAASADFMFGMKWMDDLPDSTFTIAPEDIGGGSIYYYFRRNDSKTIGTVTLDKIYYVQVGAGGLAGIEMVGNTFEQRDGLIALLNAHYGSSVNGNPEYGGNADQHMKWTLPDKNATAEIMWWNNGSPAGHKLGVRMLPLR